MNNSELPLHVINVVTSKNGKVIEVKSFPYYTAEEYYSKKMEADQYLLLKAMELDFDDYDSKNGLEYILHGYKSYYGGLYIQIIESIF